MNDYQHTISVAATPQRVFEAITTEMSRWWTPMTHQIRNIGDRTTASFEDGTTWSFEAIGLERNRLVEMRCFQADHIHPSTTPEMRTEWENTILRFEIEALNGKTSVHFTHVGLTPDVNCFEICNSGWDHFFGAGFKAYMSTHPNSSNAP